MTSTLRAIDYAGLVGKVIRMERPATDDELAHGGPPTSGMECLVAMVEDTRAADGRRGVNIVADYGYGYTVWQDEQSVWTFTIWPDDTVRMSFAQHSRPNGPAPALNDLARVYYRFTDPVEERSRVAIWRRRLGYDALGWYPIEGGPEIPANIVLRVEPLVLVPRSTQKAVADG